MPEEEDAEGESGSTASERRGGAGGRGHARQPSREAAAVSNTVAMATWPQGTGSGRNSSRRGLRARPLPPRARCHGDRPERGCAGGRGLLRPGPRMRPGPAPRGGLGRTAAAPALPVPQTCLVALLGGKTKAKVFVVCLCKAAPPLSPSDSLVSRRRRRGQGHISRPSQRFSERQALGCVRNAEGTRRAGPVLPKARPGPVWPGLTRPRG